MSDFRKSSTCEAGACVEVLFDTTPPHVVIRDSSYEEAWFSREEWIEFIAAVKRGEFDYPD